MQSVSLEEPGLADIGYGGRHEENGNVDIIGRFVDHTVVGVEDNGN